MTAPCNCGKVTPGRPRRGDECLECWLRVHRPHKVGSTAAPVPVVTPAPVLAPAPTPAPVRLGKLSRVRACKYAGPRACDTCGSPDRHCLKGHGVIQLVGKCQTCDDYEAVTTPAPTPARSSPRAALPPFPDPLTWVSTAQLVADAVALAGLAPVNCSGVVGVPRSGMLPASVIAMHLHLPLGEIDAAGKVRWLAHGTRGGSGLARQAGPILVVDDTIYAGGATRRARQQLAGTPAVFAAIYARPEAAAVADLYARPLPGPHLLEWNYPNNGNVGGLVCDPATYGHATATDLDGVLVHDDLSGGPIGTPYLAPRLFPVSLIVTGRNERHRAATEAHLRQLGIRWKRLEMLPDHVPLNTETAAAHKARVFAASPHGYFLESCPDQARLIHAQAGKPVICPRAGKVFQ